MSSRKRSIRKPKRPVEGLESRLDCLERASRHLGRKDWLNAALAAVVGCVIPNDVTDRMLAAREWLLHLFTRSL